MDGWYWDTISNTFVTEEEYIRQQQDHQELPAKPLTQKQRTVQLFCSLYGYDEGESYTAKRIKNIVLKNLPNNASMVSASLECTSKALWIALEGAMWWHRDYKAKE